MHGNAPVTLNLRRCAAYVRARRCKWVIDEATVVDVAGGHGGWSSSRCRNGTGAVLQKTLCECNRTKEAFRE